MNGLNSIYFYFGRQAFAWVGLYKHIFVAILQIGTIVFFSRAFDSDVEGMGLENYLLVLMAVTVYMDQKMIDPSYHNLFLCYQGATSTEEVENVPPVADITNEALVKITSNACKVLGFSNEASDTIRQILNGQRIRKDKDEALDDWTLTIYKLARAVSFAPPYCTPKSKITSTQYQHLVSQMILFLR